MCPPWGCSYSRFDKGRQLKIGTFLLQNKHSSGRKGCSATERPENKTGNATSLTPAYFKRISPRKRADLPSGDSTCRRGTWSDSCPVHRLHDFVKTLNASVIFENGCKSVPRKCKPSNKEVDKRPARPAGALPSQDRCPRTARENTSKPWCVRKHSVSIQLRTRLFETPFRILQIPPVRCGC